MLIAKNAELQEREAEAERKNVSVFLKNKIELFLTDRKLHIFFQPRKRPWPIIGGLLAVCRKVEQ